jgi:hypothetical protein
MGEPLTSGRGAYFQWYEDYLGWRRADIVKSIDSLSKATHDRLMDAAVRVQLQLPSVTIEDALIALVTYYATDDLMPVHELPR